MCRYGGRSGGKVGSVCRCGGTGVCVGAGGKAGVCGGTGVKTGVGNRCVCVCVCRCGKAGVCVRGQVCGVCRCGGRSGQWLEQTARCLLRPSPFPPAGGHQQRHPGDPAVRRVRLRGVSERAWGSAPHLPACEGVETRDREGVTSRVQGRGEGPHRGSPPKHRELRW